MKDSQNHTGLGIPESYFSDLEGDILREIEVQEAEDFLRSKFGLNTGFTIPEDYLHQLNQQLSDIKKQDKVFRIKKIIRISSAIAATLILALLISPFLGEELKTEKGFEELLALSEIDAEYLDYLDVDDLTWVLEDYTEESDTSSESLDFLLEDEDYLEEIASELDNL